MILCVTLNPCLDKTLVVPPWRPGDNVRGRGMTEVVGGKGNNVCRALTRLGRQARPAMLLGGAVGARCEELLRVGDSAQPIVVESRAATREILTVRREDGGEEATAFFDPDPMISSEEAETFVRRLERELEGREVQALALSGSSPARATHGVYSELIALGTARRIPVFLDTYGPALDGIWGFWPTVMQLNRREAAGYLRKPRVTDRDVRDLLEQWAGRGVECGMVTDGREPVWARVRGVEYRVIPPEIEVVNPIGSGDSQLAGLVDAWLDGSNAEDLLARAVGCGVANATVWDAGAIEPEAVGRWRERTVVERLGG
jgi:tagatose 6-phosphate kinase